MRSKSEPKTKAAALDKSTKLHARFFFKVKSRRGPSERQPLYDMLRDTHLIAAEYIDKVFDPERICVTRQLTSEQMDGPNIKGAAG